MRARDTGLGQAGFTLAEVALGLLVAVVGIVGVFSLLPVGLESGRRAVQETEAAEFAAFVFSTLNTVANRQWSDLSNDGVNGMSGLLAGTRINPVGPKDEPSDTQRLWSVTKIGPNPPHLFEWQPDNTELTGIVRSHVASRFTYRLDVGNVAANLKYAFLEVWPGQRQAAVKDAVDKKKVPDRLVYYREFYHPN